jgi:integrase
MPGKRQFGSIESLPSGRWRARYRVDGRRIAVGAAFATKADAGRYLDRVRTDIDRGTWRDPRLGRRTLAEWASEFMATKVDLKPKTLASYRSLLENRIIPGLGSMPLARIRQLDIRKWLAGMSTEGLSASRRRQALGLLGQIMRAAVADGLIVASPCVGIDAPPLPQPAPDYLTTDEVDRLLAATPRPWDLLVMILVYAGLRWGEAAALRRSSCNLLRSRLVITESLAEVNGVLHFGPTKTHQRRSVSLPSFVCERLAQHLETEVGPTDDALVFTSERGAPVRYSNFRTRVWLPATRLAGLEGIGTHIGRHTSATLLLKAGADVKDVQSHLGHRDATMTLNVYCAPYDGKLDELAARIDAAWRVARGEQANPVKTRYPPDASVPARHVKLARRR